MTPRKLNKLVVTWTDLRPVVVQGKHLCTVEDLTTGQRLQIHVASTLQCADAHIDGTKKLQEVVARIQEEGELHMADVINIEPLDDGSYHALLEWVDIYREPSWEPVADIFQYAPQFQSCKLRKIVPLSAVKRDLRRRFSMRL